LSKVEFKGPPYRASLCAPAFQGESGGRKRDPSSRRLWTALREINRYLASQSAWLVNYAERHRAGLRVGTALTEGRPTSWSTAA
jgi:hypothetical protein